MADGALEPSYRICRHGNVDLWTFCRFVSVPPHVSVCSVALRFPLTSGGLQRARGGAPATPAKAADASSLRRRRVFNEKSSGSLMNSHGDAEEERRELLLQSALCSLRRKIFTAFQITVSVNDRLRYCSLKRNTAQCDPYSRCNKTRNVEGEVCATP